MLVYQGLTSYTIHGGYVKLSKLLAQFTQLEGGCAVTHTVQKYKTSKNIPHAEFIKSTKSYTLYTYTHTQIYIYIYYT